MNLYFYVNHFVFLVNQFVFLHELVWQDIEVLGSWAPIQIHMG